MSIQQLERGDIIRPTPLETGIKPLESLVGPSVVFSERAALLALPISQGGPIEHACHRMRRQTIIQGSQGLTSSPVAKRQTERMYRGSGRSRCSRCGEKENFSNHQCGTNGTPGPQLFRQTFNILKTIRLTQFLTKNNYVTRN